MGVDWTIGIAPVLLSELNRRLETLLKDLGYPSARVAFFSEDYPRPAWDEPSWDFQGPTLNSNVLLILRG